MADRDFWQGLRLMSSGLVDAAKKASYAVGCGAGGLGLALWGVGALGVTGPSSLLIPMAAFFLLARFGRVLDERAEWRSLDERLEEFLLIQQKISEQHLKLSEGQLTEIAKQNRELAQLNDSRDDQVKIQNMYLTLLEDSIKLQNQKAFAELIEKIDKIDKKLIIK